MDDNPTPDCTACRDLGGYGQLTGPGPCTECGRFGIGSDSEHLRAVALAITDLIPPTHAITAYLNTLARRLEHDLPKVAEIAGRLELGLDTDHCTECGDVLLIRGLGLEATAAEIATKVWGHTSRCKGRVTT